MAKKLFRIKNVDRVTKSLKKIFNDVRREKRLLNEIGEFTKDRIVFEARKGNSLEGGIKHKLPPLKKSTKAIRGAIKRSAPELIDDTFFKANRSNVTLSGQLLKSIKYLIKGGSVFISVGGKRTMIDLQGVKNVSLGRTKSGKIKSTKRNKGILSAIDFAAAGSKELKTNEDVYADLKSRGFGFIGLDDKGQKRVKKLVLDEFRRTIKKLFNK